mgnify:CR=1 FL=1
MTTRSKTLANWYSVVGDENYYAGIYRDGAIIYLCVNGKARPTMKRFMNLKVVATGLLNGLRSIVCLCAMPFFKPLAVDGAFVKVASRSSSYRMSGWTFL